MWLKIRGCKLSRRATPDRVSGCGIPVATERNGINMRLHFFGATHEVTGSCYYIESSGKKILVDCGMLQGPDEYDEQAMPVNPADVDYVFLTHAHIDHSGRLPLLSKMGFRGTVYCTYATGELCGIMLLDSAHIQEFEAEWKKRKNKRAGEDSAEPLYTTEDAENVLKLFKTYGYANRIQVCEGIDIRFVDAGHLLGSSSIEIWLEEAGITKKLVFSGDIGNLNQPLIRDPSYIAEADYVIMESTYGDRNHNPPPDYALNFAQIIQRTFDRGGNVVIPSFAVGRTQEILYFIRDILNRGLIEGRTEIPVYVDSPLAVKATNIFNENTTGYFDDEALSLVRKGINPISFNGLKISVTSDDSKAINFDPRSKVIVSASGMCEAGRIRHHLKHNLWRQECTVVFVGYQAEGTLGRILKDGVKTVKLFGETISVKAEIVELEGVSAHADKEGLIRWIKAFEKKPGKVFVVHGESSVCDSFASLLRDGFNYSATAPNFESCYDLLADSFVYSGTAPSPKTAQKREDKRGATVYRRLEEAGQRLIGVIKRNRGGANKDIAKFADQINDLCDKWDRN